MIDTWFVSSMKVETRNTRLTRPCIFLTFLLEMSVFYRFKRVNHLAGDIRKRLVIKRLNLRNIIHTRSVVDRPSHIPANPHLANALMLPLDIDRTEFAPSQLNHKRILQTPGKKKNSNQ